jgi:hypothetical protein
MITSRTEVSDSDAESVVTHHLLFPVRDMRTHGGQSFQSGETHACPFVLGRVDDLPLLIQVLHMLLAEGRPDGVAGQVFHDRIISGRDLVAAEDVGSGIPPC